MAHADRPSAIQFKSPTVKPEDCKGYAEQLRESELFRGLRKPQRESILNAGTWQHRKAGTLFFCQGDPASSLNLLVSGRVKVYSVAPEGHRLLLGFVVPGDSFGCGVLVTGATRLTSAEATLDSVVIAWDGDTLARLMQAYPPFALSNFVTAQDRARLLIERLEEFTAESVGRRIAKSLVRLAGQLGEKTDGRVIITGNFRLKDLAELTGTTIYTVSRVLGQWRRQGIVEKHRGRLVLSDVTKLHQLAAVIGLAASALPTVS